MEENIDDIVAAAAILKEQKPKKELVIRSDEMNEILGTPPKAIIRYGVTVIGAIIVMIVVGSAFIRYPDVIPVPITITTQSPPEMLVARSAGKPMAILVEDKVVVKPNQVVAIMQNSARYGDMLKLKAIVEQNGGITPSVAALATMRFPVNLSLGEVQGSYNELIKAQAELALFMNQQFYPKKERAMIQQIEGYKAYRAKMSSQMAISQQDYKLILKQLKRDSLLLSQKVIAAADYEKTESAMLARKGSVAQQSISATNAEIEQARLEQSLTELRMEAQNKQQQLESSLVGLYNQLRSAVAQWEEKYILKTHQAGKLTYLKVWSTSQEVRAGEILFAVIPQKAGKIVGVATVNKAAIGKVAEGQNVNIKLSGYPNQEFGTLRGKVLNLSLAPGDSIYAATISIPQNLVTTYRRQLHLRGELTGTAEISTDELSILARVWSPLKYMITQQKN